MLQRTAQRFSSSSLRRRLMQKTSQIIVSIKMNRQTNISQMKNKCFTHCGRNERRRNRRGAYLDSRQTHIWSYRISIHFQLSKGSRLNLQEADGEYERRKWLRGSTREHRGSTGEHWENMSEHRGSMGEQRERMGEQREHMDKTGDSGRAKRRDLSQRPVTFY